MKKSKKIVLVFIIIFFFFGCQSKESRTVPVELRGVWRTSAPKYKSCYFELTENEIIFTNENYLDEMQINYISNIEKIIPGKRILYAINYVDDDDSEYELSFYYDPSEGEIRFKNQQQIKWKKTKGEEY
ncbi:MAG: hypothetical protein H8D67_04040 [Deltaproteobacteria bacterium]|nr:hypothetical protein [Deltaproteobacteria bacterium]MBL7177267.1 hypothetical protein [Desulfobacteraceae bacterium]